MLGPFALVLLAPLALVLHAEALPSADRLRVRLSVTNVSSRPQTLWMATPSCNASRWRVTPPEVRVIDYAQEVSAVCPIACRHRRLLRPGETFVRTVEPDMPRRQKYVYKGQTREYGLRPGPLTLTFRLLQPNPATINDASLPEAVRYSQIELKSNPVQTVIRPKWLHASAGASG